MQSSASAARFSRAAVCSIGKDEGACRHHGNPLAVAAGGPDRRGGRRGWIRKLQLVRLLAPAKTPKEIVQALNRAVSIVLQSGTFKALARPQGLEVVGGAPDVLRLKIGSEFDRWKTVIEISGVKEN